MTLTFRDHTPRYEWLLYIYNFIYPLKGNFPHLLANEQGIEGGRGSHIPFFDLSSLYTFKNVNNLVIA